MEVHMNHTFCEQSHITMDIHSRDHSVWAGNSKHSSWQ